ncbi:MAG: exonuclease domain-containing protein [Pseudomonadota bacterium]
MSAFRSANTFWLFAALSVAVILAILVGIGLTVWQNLTPELQASALLIISKNFEYLFAAGFLVMAGVGFGLDAIFHIYILPLNRVAEETTLIFSSNPSYRLKPEGGKDVVNLARVINEAAEKFQHLNQTIDQRISQASLETETEKNILAAIMAELPEGVLICNISGRIILYNRHAKQVFSKPSPTVSAIPSTDKAERFVGLGRSIFNLIDKNLIVHAINETQERLSQEQENMASYFIAPVSSRSLYRFETVPILDKTRNITGFILIFKEITEDIILFKKMDSVMESFTKEARSLVGDLATCLEEKLPAKDTDRSSLKYFQGSLTQKSQELLDRIEHIAHLFREKMDSEWPIIPLTSEKLFETLQKKAGFRYGIRINIMEYDKDSIIQVEPYSFTTGFMFILQKLSASTSSDEFEIYLSSSSNHIHIDVAWDGLSINETMLNQWKIQLVVTEEDHFPCSLNDIFKLHHGSLTTLGPTDKEHYNRLRITLETRECQPVKTARKSLVITPSRPEFYDFDLYNRNGDNAGLMMTDLSGHTFTAFDTETTGLDPDHGDEIISIGAVRIVNCKVQYNETFEHLVDPKRTVPLESVKIHGISNDLLKGKPPIEKVLPGFFRFAEDTILLGHNIAFDMKMLQKNEQKTGIVFLHPVLDTLLLSAIAHPLQTNHTMEAIAARLGVNIMGRHTALGDALATAEIFLRLLPLLQKKGIVCLKDAIEVSKKTYFARLKY